MSLIRNEAGKDALSQQHVLSRIIHILYKDMIKNKYIYLMMLPGILYYLIFHYIPMYGATIAFKQFTPAAGVWGSHWVGFKHFQDFLTAIILYESSKIPC